jgi:hypothetical protein
MMIFQFIKLEYSVKMEQVVTMPDLACDNVPIKYKINEESIELRMQINH